MTENGYGKRTRDRRVPAQGPRRHGREDRAAHGGEGRSSPARASSATGYQVMLISTGGTVIRMPVDDIKRLGRSTQGVIVMRLREGEQVSALAPVVESDDERRRRPSDRRPAETRSSATDLRRLLPRNLAFPLLFQARKRVYL